MEATAGPFMESDAKVASDEVNAIAATTIRLRARLLTRNVKHFPMFPDLRAPY